MHATCGCLAQLFAETLDPIAIIDILVEVERGRTLLEVIALEQDLELLGCSVEALTNAGLSFYLQQRMLIEAAAL